MEIFVCWEWEGLCFFFFLRVGFLIDRDDNLI
jgi:hypothetical protein